MRFAGPDSKYIMMWRGAWRPVMNLFDHNSAPTTDALRAAKVVLFVNPDHWVATLVNPGDLILRPGRDPNETDWEYID